MVAPCGIALTSRRKDSRASVTTAAHNRGTPTNVMGLANLAGEDIMARNRINRTMFEVIETKWVKAYNPVNDAAQEGCKRRQCSRALPLQR